MDICRVSSLPPQKQNAIHEWLNENGLPYTEISALSGSGIEQCKKMACEEVLKLKMPVNDSKLIKS